uniref:ShKT domain-containing protein n=1 Tax=Rhabditophanes sp. KR3021 TaxID=114890 RepID=A0AC35UIB5_9BILA
MQFLKVALLLASFCVSSSLAVDPPAVVTTTTMGSTTADPNACTDLASNCAMIASFCLKPNYAATMLANCRKTCFQCNAPAGPNPACADLVTNCNVALCNIPVWAPLYESKCKSTCNRC